VKVAGDGIYTQRVTSTRAVHDRNHASMTRGALVAMVALTVLGAAACGSSSRSTSTTPSLPGHVLAEEATTGDTLTDNFNPFDAASTAHAMDVTSLMYEPLFEFNALNPAQINPWLATAYGFNSAGTPLTITVKSN
jgi:peptide/nickel transport system substrate-binding protein